MAKKKSKNNSSIVRHNGKGKGQTNYKAPLGRPSTKAKNPGQKKKVCDAICSQIDPFCASGCQAKVYDNNGTHTLPYQVKLFLSLTTLATGDAALSIRPGMGAMYAAATSISGGVPTFPAASTSPNYASIAASFTEYRVVSFGVRVFGSCSLNASQGVVMLGTQNTAGASNIGSSNFSDVLRLPLNDCEATWVGRLEGAENEFFPIANNADFTNLIIGVTGAAASTAVLGVEVTMNVELVASIDQFISRMVSSPSPSVPQIMAAAQQVARKVKPAQAGTVAARSKSYMELAEQAFTWAFQNSGNIATVLELL
jgi:hypothetical protein